MGLVLLAYHCFLAVVDAAFGSGGSDIKKSLEKRGAAKRAFHVGVVCAYAFVAFVAFGVSVPRFLVGMNSRNVPHVPREVLEFGRRIGHLEVTHSYGLFRR